MVGKIYLAKIYFTDLSEYKYIATINQEKQKEIFNIFCQRIGCK